MDNSAAAGTRTEDAFALLLRRAVLGTAPVGLAAVVVAGVVRGGSAAVSAAVGALIVTAFFGARLVVMRRIASRDPQLVLMTALALYTAKVVLLGLAMVLLTRWSAIDGQVLGITVLVCAVVWLAVEMRGVVRMRVPIFTPPADTAAPGEPKAPGR